MIVMVRAIELVSLLHQIFVRRQFFRRDLELARPVGGDVQMHRYLGAGIDIDAREIFTRQNGQIHHVFRVVVLKWPPDPSSAVPIPSPAGISHPPHLNAARKIAGGIEQHRVPFQIDDHIGGDHAAFPIFDRREILKIHRHLARAIGHIDMESKDIDGTPCPGTTWPPACTVRPASLLIGPLGE